MNASQIAVIVHHSEFHESAHEMIFSTRKKYGRFETNWFIVHFFYVALLAGAVEYTNAHLQRGTPPTNKWH